MIGAMRSYNIPKSNSSNTRHWHKGADLDTHRNGDSYQSPMQIGVTINGKTLLTLLHSVSTHNFINAKTLHSLNLPIEPVSKRIKSDSGQWRPHIDVGICRNLQLSVGRGKFHIDCYSIPLGNYDIILGINWLSSLGPIIWDFENWPWNSGGKDDQYFGQDTVEINHHCFY